MIRVHDQLSDNVSYHAMWPSLDWFARPIQLLKCKPLLRNRIHQMQVNHN